jgi:hypothetical protein
MNKEATNRPQHAGPDLEERAYSRACALTWRGALWAKMARRAWATVAGLSVAFCVFPSGAEGIGSLVRLFRSALAALAVWALVEGGVFVFHWIRAPGHQRDELRAWVRARLEVGDEVEQVLTELRKVCLSLGEYRQDAV